jgi:hypothetical protein
MPQPLQHDLHPLLRLRLALLRALQTNRLNRRPDRARTPRAQPALLLHRRLLLPTPHDRSRSRLLAPPRAPLADLLPNPRLQRDGNIDRRRLLAAAHGHPLVPVLLNHAQHVVPVQVPALARHPALAHVHDALLEDEALGAAVGRRVAHVAGRQQFDDGGRHARALEVQAHGREALGVRVEVALDGVCGGDVAGVGVWVAQEVGERDGAEAVVVGVVRGPELDHCCGYVEEGSGWFDGWVVFVGGDRPWARFWRLMVVVFVSGRRYSVTVDGSGGRVSAGCDEIHSLA